MNEKNKKNKENSAPFIGLIPIPSLTIDCVDVDFQMEVRDSGVTTYNISEDAHTDISSKWFEQKVEIQGYVPSVREKTRTSDHKL